MANKTSVARYEGDRASDVVKGFVSTSFTAATSVWVDTAGKTTRIKGGKIHLAVVTGLDSDDGGLVFLRVDGSQDHIAGIAVIPDSAAAGTTYDIDLDFGDGFLCALDETLRLDMTSFPTTGLVSAVGELWGTEE
jgi:hypothetical protein